MPGSGIRHSPQTMHVLFYSNWYIKQTLQLANVLAAHHRVTLIFPDRSPELNSFGGQVGELRRFLHPDVTLTTFPHMQDLDPLGIWPVWKTRKIIRQLKPDIVHFNESYDIRSWLLMLLCPGTSFVTTVHDPAPHAGEKISLQQFKHWVRDQIRKRSHGLIVHGQGLRDVLSEYSGVPTRRIYSVPHGEYRFYTYFDQKPSEPQDGLRRILFFGRWEDYKGMDVLMDAEPLITQRFPEVRIVLAGEGRLTLADLLPRMIHPANFEIRNYPIPDDEVPALFRAADVVVLPYHQATQSGPLHIAGTFSKPAVVTRVGALPEIVRDGETGILIPPGDPKALAEAVCDLLLHPDKARRIGQNAHDQMTRSQSLEEVAQIQSDAYRQIIASRQAPRPGFILRVLQRLVRQIKRDPNYALDESLRASDLAAMLLKLTFSLLRGLFYRPFLKEVRGFCFVNAGAKLRNCGHIILGRNFIAESNCEIQGLSKSGVIFGDNVTVGSFAMIRPSGYYGREIGQGVKIGDRSNIGAYCYLGASGGITIGQDVLMGPRVSLFAENHNHDRTDIPMRAQGCTRQAIAIGDDCWLGSGSIILAGVHIGRGSIIAAGAIVTQNIPPYSIVGGNPARVIRSRRMAVKTTETEA